MTIYSESGEPIDNKALRKIRDILEESRKHTWIMIVLTMIIAILTIVIIIKT